MLILSQIVNWLPFINFYHSLYDYWKMFCCRIIVSLWVTTMLWNILNNVHFDCWTIHNWIFSSQAINPCNDGTHGCHSYADCFYLGPGKNNCTCAAGYKGDGVVCSGKISPVAIGTGIVGADKLWSATAIWGAGWETS